MLSEFYLPTDAQKSCFKRIFRYYLILFHFTFQKPLGYDLDTMFFSLQTQ